MVTHLMDNLGILTLISPMDELVILVLINCFLIPALIFIITLIETSILGCHLCLIKCTLTSTSRRGHMSFSYWLDVWRWSLDFPTLISRLSLKTPFIFLFLFSFLKLLSFFLCFLVSSLHTLLIHGWLYCY